MTNFYWVVIYEQGDFYYAKKFSTKEEAEDYMLNNLDKKTILKTKDNWFNYLMSLN